MSKFYFTAVSNSAKKKLVGSFESETEREARDRINKFGMAILSIGNEPPLDCLKPFVFSVTETNGQEFVGELFEESAQEAFGRLENEFTFRKINYIFAAEISEEEKIYALQNSVSELREQKRKEEEHKVDLEKRTITGSIKSLVTLNFGDKKKSASETENAAKYSNDGEEDLTKKSEVDFPDQSQVSAALNPVGADVPPSGDEIYALLEGDENIVLAEDIDVGEQLKKLQHGFGRFFPAFSKKFGQFYFHITEIVVPSEGKTRMDGLHDMFQFLFPPKQLDEKLRLERIKALKRQVRFNRFWVAFAEIVDLLAAVFLGYLVLGVTSFYVEIPRISELAELTLRNNFTIHFLVGAFIFLRILILLREKFTSWSFWRTTLLFLVGSFMIVFAGLNLL